MTNKELIAQELGKMGFVIGCYDEAMEKLSKKSLKDVLDYMTEEHTDVDVRINRKCYVVEISTVDNEKDFNALTKTEYIARYGTERWED